MDSLGELIQAHASAVFVLIGAVVGSAATFVVNWFLRRRELQLRLWERVLDRRIRAHEQALELARTARIMISLGRKDEEGELARAPAVLRSKEELEQWYAGFSDLSGRASPWLGREVVRELNLFQDYMVNLFEFVRPLEDRHLLVFGGRVRQDFIDFSSKIEQLAFRYFSRDLRRLRLNDLSEWHKYPRSTTEKRLDGTQLFRRREELERLLAAVAKHEDGANDGGET